MAKVYTVYILTNRSGTLYIGVTSDLLRRMWQHRTKGMPGFTNKYHIGRLVYFEQTASCTSAIEREKQLKRWSRRKKIWLIEQSNPNWADLAAPWFDDGADDSA